MRNQLLSGIMLAALAGTSNADAQRPRRETPFESYVSSHQSASVAVERFRQAKGEECSGQAHREAKLYIAIATQVGEGAIAVRPRSMLEVRSDIAKLYIELGNAGLERRCLAEARQGYLTVIETYIGSGFAAIRQRAQIGVDDVRAAANSPPPPPPPTLPVLPNMEQLLRAMP